MYRKRVLFVMCIALASFFWSSASFAWEEVAVEIETASPQAKGQFNFFVGTADNQADIGFVQTESGWYPMLAMSEDDVFEEDAVSDTGAVSLSVGLRFKMNF